MQNQDYETFAAKAAMHRHGQMKNIQSESSELQKEIAVNLINKASALLFGSLLTTQAMAIPPVVSLQWKAQFEHQFRPEIDSCRP